MPNEGPGRAGLPGGAAEGSESSSDANPNPNSNTIPGPLHGERQGDGAAVLPPMLSIVISQPEEIPNPKGVSVSKGADRDEKAGTVADEKKCGLPRSESDREQCRVCQHQTEEPLMDLGCRCRGGLAKAHRSCIEIWFRTRGSNKCEICQQVAANVPSPESQPSTNYWVWRFDSTNGGANIGRGERERGCFSPLWVVFAILIGGLSMDILISISLGVSALPVNVIIGVLIVLGLGTAFRLGLDCCHELGSRRSMQRPDMTVNPMTINPGYHPAV